MLIYLSENAPRSLTSEFCQSEIIKVCKTNLVYPAVSAHPDIYYCTFPDGSVIHAESDELGYMYPDNIAFNAVCLRQYFIHNLKYTNKRVLRKAEMLGLRKVHVNQGYTKCSCVVVDGRSVITSDIGIFQTLKQYEDISVLKVREGFVKLNGFPYGFLGGASGRCGDTVYFCGNLSGHPDAEKIYDFITSRGLKVKCSNGPLTDIGSILTDEGFY